MSILQYQNVVFLMDMGILPLLELYVKSPKEGHNNTQIMSCVHMSNSRFKNKDSRYWNPSALDQI